jgi:hypothetical protein
MTATITTIDTTFSSASSQILPLPERASGTTWEEIEQKLGIRRTGRMSAVMQSAFEVSVPAGWDIVDSDESPFFQRWLVDATSKRQAKLFYKDYRADFIQLVND